MPKRNRLVKRLKRHSEMSILHAERPTMLPPIQRAREKSHTHIDQPAVKAFLPIPAAMAQTSQPSRDQPANLLSDPYNWRDSSTGLGGSVEPKSAQSSMSQHPVQRASLDQQVGDRHQAEQTERSGSGLSQPTASTMPQRVWQTVQRLWKRDASPAPTQSAGVGGEGQSTVPQAPSADKPKVETPKPQHLGPVNPVASQLSNLLGVNQTEETKASSEQPIQAKSAETGRVIPTEAARFASNELAKVASPESLLSMQPIQRGQDVPAANRPTDATVSGVQDTQPVSHRPVAQAPKTQEFGVQAKSMSGPQGAYRVTIPPVAESASASLSSMPIDKLATVAASGAKLPLDSQVVQRSQQAGGILEKINTSNLDVMPSAGEADQEEKVVAKEPSASDPAWDRLKRLSAMHDRKAMGLDINQPIQRDASDLAPASPASPEATVVNDNQENLVTNARETGFAIASQEEVSELETPNPVSEIVQAAPQKDDGEIGNSDSTYKRPQSAEKASSPSPVQRSFKSTSPGSQREESPINDPSSGQPEMDDALISSATKPALQDAWPVQRVENEIQPSLPSRLEMNPAVEVDAVQASTEVIEPMLAKPDKPSMQVNDRVSQILGGIGSSRPSHSSVQVLPPRGSRPKRPVQAKKQGAVQPPPDPKDALANFLNKDFGSSFSPREAPAPVQMAELEGQKPEVRNQIAEAADVSSAHADPELIGTEVGVLPADFWSILGDSPPVQSQSLPTSSVTDAPIQRAEAFLETLPSSNPAVMPEKKNVSMPIVQRTEADFASATDHNAGIDSGANGTMPADAEEGELEDKNESDIDLDELAHKIYKSLKKKLDVEWERRKLR